MGRDKAKQHRKENEEKNKLHSAVESMAKAHQQLTRTMEATCRRQDVLLACLANKIKGDVSCKLNALVLLDTE